MNIYKVTFKREKDYNHENEMVVAESIEGAISIIKSERQSKFRFEPIVIETSLVQEDVLINQ